MAPSRSTLASPGLSLAAASPSSFVEELARRQWNSLKKNKSGRGSSREATPSRPTPAQAAAELRQRLDETKRQRSRSRSRDRGENSDYNVSREGHARVPQSAKRGRSPPATTKRGSSLILAAAERQWDGLNGSGRRRGRVPDREPPSPHRGDSADRTSTQGDCSERDAKPIFRAQSELPQHIVTLLVQVCGSRGAAQEQSAEKLRDLVHDRETAKLVAEEEWALEALARPLIDGTDRARVACAACFRHLALDSGGSSRMLQSPLILTALVTALRHGTDDTRQKAAAAIGNLAWRSEASRAVIIVTAGVMDGLLLLLRFGPPPGRESALAALSNLTLNQLCSNELVRAPEALSELVGEMLTGSAKGQLRAAGIVRNIAAKHDNREALQAFPGVVPVLQRLAAECTQEETQQRAAKALKLIVADALPSKGGQSGRDGAATALSLSRGSSPGAPTSADSSPRRPGARSLSVPSSATPVAGEPSSRGRARQVEGRGEWGAGVAGTRRALMKPQPDRLDAP